MTSSPSSKILSKTSLMNNKMSRSPYTSYTTTPLGVGGNTEYSTGGCKNNSGSFRLRYLGHGRNLKGLISTVSIITSKAIPRITVTNSMATLGGKEVHLMPIYSMPTYLVHILSKYHYCPHV